MRLESEVFSKPEVARALEPNFVMVKLNVDESPGTAQLYGVSSIPTDVITLPNGRLVWQVQSPPAANQYIAQMNQAAAGHRALMQGPPAQAVAAAPPAVAPPAAAPGAAAMAPPSAPPAARGNDRYAEYFAQPPAAQPQAGPAHYAGAAMPQAPVATAPSVAANMHAPVGAVQPAAGGYGAQTAAYRPDLPPAPQLPPGAPPLALDGYCPTTLVERQQWALGDVRFGAIHRGRTYLFLGPGEVQKFMADPEKYAPVLSGNDPVLALDNQQLVPGRREYGVYSDNRVYLFADESSRQRFEQNPKRYAAESLQAATPPATAVR
jgi:protein disulfide-isomerase